MRIRFKPLLLQVSLALVGATIIATPPAALAATSKSSKTATSSKKASTAPSTKKQSATPAKSSAAGRKSTTKTTAGKTTTKTGTTKAAAKSPARSEAGDTRCRTVRVKTAKGYQNRRVCTKAEPPALQNSPIKANALSAPMLTSSSSAADVKGRTVPDRAYAVDGETFFHQGRKFRVQGIPPGALSAGGDHAKQKLQMALDAGTLSVMPVSTDATGVTTAVVRVNGRNIADTLGAGLPPQQAVSTPAVSAPVAAPVAVQPALPAVPPVAPTPSAVTVSPDSSSSSSSTPRFSPFEQGEGISPGADSD